MDRPAEDDPALGEVGNEVSGVGYRTGEPVQADHHQRVTGPARRHRLPQTRSRPGSHRSAPRRYRSDLPRPRRGQRRALGHEICRFAAASGVDDPQLIHHPRSVPVEVPSSKMAPGGVCATLLVRGSQAVDPCRWWFALRDGGDHTSFGHRSSRPARPRLTFGYRCVPIAARRGRPRPPALPVWQGRGR